VRSSDPPVLEFRVADARAVADGVPVLRLTLVIDAAGRAVDMLRLKVAVRIAAERRRYSAREAEGLWELFGPVEQWGRSLGRIAWDRLGLVVPQFVASTSVALEVPGATDPGAAAGKYLAAVREGDVPLELLFSGTVSWRDGGGRLQTAMVPWDREAAFRMPVAAWRQVLGAVEDPA
jgi:Family of unknown function (DUF6084)